MAPRSADTKNNPCCNICRVDQQQQEHEAAFKTDEQSAQSIFFLNVRTFPPLPPTEASSSCWMSSELKTVMKTSHRDQNTREHRTTGSVRQLIG